MTGSGAGLQRRRLSRGRSKPVRIAWLTRFGLSKSRIAPKDLQMRAEIIIQPEEGRWVFTPNELSDLAEGLNSVLLKSKPEGGWPFRLTLKQYVGLFDH